MKVDATACLDMQTAMVFMTRLDVRFTLMETPITVVNVALNVDNVLIAHQETVTVNPDLETVMKTMKQTDVKPITPLSNTVAIAATTAVPTLFVPVDCANVIPVC